MGFSILLLASTILLFSPGTSAWGANTHETIAQLALRYLLPETVEWLNKLLPDKGSTDAGMTFISTWPDGYAHKCADGKWTRELHFIDARDVTAKTIKNPPLVCSVEMTRDCGNGYCVVGAIQNYTSIIQRQFQNKNSICAGGQASSEQRRPPKDPQNHIQAHNFQANGFPPLEPETLTDAELALRFLVHFIGDIHQPLHAEGYSLGGNNIKVHFNRKEKTLHAVWDTQIPEAIFEQLPGGANGAVDYLYQHIEDMDKSSNVWKNEWVGKCFEGIEDEVLELQSITPERSEVCALQWARWANHYICTYVLQYGSDTSGMELGKEYTKKAEPIIVELVSMAGWKLGGWLNLLATGKLGLGLEPVRETLAAGREEVQEEDHFRGAHTTLPGHNEL